MISTALLVPGVLLTSVGRITLAVALTSAYVVASGPETSIFVLERSWVRGVFAILVTALAVAAFVTPRPRVREVLTSSIATALCVALVAAFGPVLLRPAIDVHGTLIRADEESLGPLGYPAWLIAASALVLGLGVGVRRLAAVRVPGAAPDEADARCYERAAATGFVALATYSLLFPALIRLLVEVGVSLPPLFEGARTMIELGRWALDAGLFGVVRSAETPRWLVLLLLVLLPAIPLALARRHRVWRIVATVWMLLVTGLACALGLGVGAALVELGRRM